MFADERRQVILQVVHRNGAVAIRDLAEQLGSTEVTIRRDLRKLEAEGLLDRRHGGAVPVGGLTKEPSYTQKAHVAAAEKAAIGFAAAQLVHPGDAIAIGAGTTTEALARCLVNATDLTVVTNSLLVASALAGAGGVDVVMTGGSLRGAIFALVGSAAEQSVRGVRTDRVFISGNGLSATHGLSTPNQLVSGVDRALVGTAQEVVVLADHSKVGVETMVQTVPVAEMDRLITDDGTDPEALTEFAAAGVEIRVTRTSAIGSVDN